MHAFSFPNGFRLGVASAATQIEGDNQNSNWYDWYQKGHIKDGSDPDVTTAHYRRVTEDADLMADLGIRDARIGLEWARLEPAPGQFDEAAFQHYRDELCLLQARGIHVLLTLHHFSNPIWFEQQGAFLSRDAVPVFLRYVDAVLAHLGDLVQDYITINEPNVYATCGYLFGSFPPGETSVSHTFRVMRVMAKCHRLAYDRIHKWYADQKLAAPLVSFAAHLRAFAPKKPNSLWQRFLTPIARWAFQGHVHNAFSKKGKYVDFWGLNYYSRTAVAGLKDDVMDDCCVTDLGWEIYPNGIVECCKELQRIKQLSIFITENGVCDNRDAYRGRYLYEHLHALSQSGLPVERYYHWCFVDNFEWLEGMTAKFGLVSLSPDTLARIVKKSGWFYAEMIKAHGVTAKMYDTYCRAQYPVKED